MSAPLVEVTTCLPGRTGHDGSPGEVLARLPHRDAAVERRDWLAFASEPASDPERPVAFSDAQSPHRPGVLTSQAAVLAALQAARSAYGTTAATIASRHCPPPRHRLVPADRPQSQGVARLASPGRVLGCLCWTP